MLWVYIIIPVIAIIALYLVLDRKRLLLFFKINRLVKNHTDMIKIDIPVRELEELTRSTVSHTIDTGDAILFEYRTQVYIAIPLGEREALISQVADRKMINRYRTSRSKVSCHSSCGQSLYPRSQPRRYSGEVS